MKSLVVAAVLFVSTFVSAPAFARHFDASTYNCAYLQMHLAHHGEISIARLFGWTTYTAQPQCNAAEEARVHYEWAADTNACALGWTCVSTGG